MADPEQERPWAVLFLENCYLKIMILPELGGRVQMALDKTNDYDFDYCNRIINPPLVGRNGSYTMNKSDRKPYPSQPKSL